MPKSTLGERIRHARKELKMTQEQLAGKDFTKGFISLVELDKAKPSLESLTVLAARLKRPLTYFLEDRLESKQDIDLLNTLGQAYLKSGDTAKAHDMFSEALRLAREMEDTERAARSLCNNGLAFMSEGDYETAIADLEESLRHYFKAGAHDEASKTLFALGTAYHRQRKLTQAIEAYRQSLQQLDRLDRSDSMFRLKLLTNLANAYWKVGELKDAKLYYQQAAEEAENASDFDSVGSAYMGLSLLYRERGETAKALDYATRALEVFEGRENIQLMADLHNNIGILHADQGNWDRALNHYQNSLRLRDFINDTPKQAYTYTELARYYFCRSDLDQATEYCERALKLLDELDDPLEVGRTLMIKGLIEKANSNWTQATDLLEKSAAIFSKYDTKRELAETYSELGFLYSEQGDAKRSNEFLARSVSLFKESGKDGSGQWESESEESR